MDSTSYLASLTVGSHQIFGFTKLACRPGEAQLAGDRRPGGGCSVRTEPVSASCASCESASPSAPPAYSCVVSAARSYRYR